MAKTFSSIHLRRYVAPALAGLFMAAAGRAGGGPSAAEGTALCAGGPTRLCLHGRYEVQATWQDEHGRDHAALAMPLGRGTGAFSLIGGDSVDLLVRVPTRAASDADVDVANLSGAAYAVRVFDRESGASWTRAADAAPREVFRAVASALETTDGVVAPAAALEGCVDSGHSRCLLGGRFEVRVSATGDDQ